jgi:hypothetical protein
MNSASLMKARFDENGLLRLEDESVDRDETEAGDG